MFGDVLRMVTSSLLAVHLLCVNLASGGPLLAAWLDWRGTRDQQETAPIGQSALDPIEGLPEVLGDAAAAIAAKVQCADPRQANAVGRYLLASSWAAGCLFKHDGKKMRTKR